MRVTQMKLALVLVVGAAIGGAAVQTLRAEAKPPVYSISEIDVSDVDGFVKDYLPRVRAAIKGSGGRLLATSANANITTFEGEPQKNRIAIQAWNSLEDLIAYRNSAGYKEARAVGDKYAKFRVYALEGFVPQ